MKILKKLFRDCYTAYDHKIIITIGLNGYSPEETKKEADDIAKSIEIKLLDYLKQFPYNITVK